MYNQIRKMGKLTVLSYGGGQDSTALLYKYVYDPGFRRRYAPEDFIVVMSDTGDEHPETYKYIRHVEHVCVKHDIPFYFITKEKGFHSEKWPDLRSFYRRTSTCGSKAFMKTCTDNLKLKPIYRFLEHHVHTEYQTEKYGRKQAFYEFAEKYGKINMMIGIAKGEERRIAGGDKSPLWSQRTINKIYPLVDLEMDRQACQDFITAMGEPLPLPSNCMLCPYMSEIELLWLYYNYPEDLLDWMIIEEQKIRRYAAERPGEKNHGVWAGKTLMDKLEEAQQKYAHMSREEVHEYKMSHGHCVMSAY